MSVEEFIEAVRVPPSSPVPPCNADRLAAAMVLLGIHQPGSGTSRKELSVRLARFALAVWRTS